MSGRGRRWLCRLLVATSVVLIAHGATLLAGATAQLPGAAGQASANATAVSRGRALFVQACATCHGFNAGGVPGMGPSVFGVGAQAADFYLSTGRMPLNNPRDPPVRNTPMFNRGQINDLVAYVGSFGGPPIPVVDPAQGNIAHGLQEFALNCAGCHQIEAAGGIVTGGIAPPLNKATAVQIVEAARTGPFLMPRFTASQLSDYDLNSIARYVVQTRDPADRGGWGIGHIGPIPEGMVAWLIALVALVVVARLIGERSEV
jgi:ubiquinol-cytochrome c reductase cytochrome c subunit